MFPEITQEMQQWFNLIVAIYIVVWGIYDGITTTFIRIRVLFSSELVLSQSNLGRFLYWLWVLSVVYLTTIYVKG